MSTRSVVLLGLILVVCVAVIIASALVREQLTTVFGPFRFRELSRLAGLFAPRPFGPAESFRRSSPVFAVWRGIASAVASYAFLFLVGLLALFVFPRQLRVIRDAFGQGASGLLKTFGIGAFSALVFLLVTVLGVFTLWAFVIPLVLPVALLLAACGGLIGLALALGRVITRWAGLKQPSPILDLAFGTLVLYTLARVPIAGAILLGIMGLLALGAVIATHFGAGGAWSLSEFSTMEEVQS